MAKNLSDEKSRLSLRRCHNTMTKKTDVKTEV